MPSNIKTSKPKVFDRVAFDKIKMLQKRKWTREHIMEKTGYGRETVRKAMKAPSWPQYRKNEKNALRRRRELRGSQRTFHTIAPTSVWHEDSRTADMLVDKSKETLSSSYAVRTRPSRYEIVAWSAAAITTLVLIVLLWKAL